MQKRFILLSFFICFILFKTPSVHAQRVYVRMKPEHQSVLLRPTPPDSNSVWINEEWVWDMRSKQYVVVEGYWVAPKRGKRWVSGYWKDTRRGSYWVEGHWQRT